MKVQEIYQQYLNGNRKDAVKAAKEYGSDFWLELAEVVALLNTDKDLRYNQFVEFVNAYHKINEIETTVS
ncbi:MAG: hypothetical protein ACOCP8_02740 [archaeon]